MKDEITVFLEYMISEGVRLDDTVASLGSFSAVVYYLREYRKWKAKIAPVNQDANIAIQQGAIADLPAADSGIAKYETAIQVCKEYSVDYSSQSYVSSFILWCQRQLTTLAGR